MPQKISSAIFVRSSLNIHACPASNYQQPAKPLRRAGSINAKIYSADARLELHSDDDEDDVKPASQVSSVSKYQKLVHRTPQAPVCPAACKARRRHEDGGGGGAGGGFATFLCSLGVEI